LEHANPIVFWRHFKAHFARGGSRIIWKQGGAVQHRSRRGVQVWEGSVQGLYIPHIFFLFFHFSKWRFSAFWCIFSKFFYVCSVYKIISLSKKCWQWRQGGGRQICPCVHPPMYSTQDTTSSHYKARPVPRPAVPQNTTEPILVWGMSASRDSTWGYTFTSVIINLLRCDSTSEWTRMRRWLWYSPWGDVDLLLIMSTNSTTSYVGLSTVTCQRGLSWVRRTRITTHINMTGCEHKELTFKSSYLIKHILIHVLYMYITYL